MKKAFIIIVLLSVLVNGIVGQVVNSYPIPGVTSQNLDQCLLLDQKIWLGDEGSYPVFYYSGSAWIENYDYQTGTISGVKGSNNQDVVYSVGRDATSYFNLFRWNNSSNKWNSISGRPYDLRMGAEIKVVDESNIYLLSQIETSPKLYRFNGTTYIELYMDATTSYENWLYADTAKVVFSRRGSGEIIYYDIDEDTIYSMVTIPGISGINSVKSVNGRDFFILSREGNLYVYLGHNQILVDLIICPETESEWYSNTMEVVSTNRLIFIGGSKGLKKIWISNNGDPVIQTIYNITHPELKVTSSSVFGNTAIFAGALGNGEYCFYLRVDFSTGVVETVLPDINIYPNPSKDWIKIDGISEVSDVQIFDITGKLILQQEYQVDDRIDISNLTVGMYILNIRNSEGEFSQKIIKQ